VIAESSIRLKSAPKRSDARVHTAVSTLVFNTLVRTAKGAKRSIAGHRAADSEFSAGVGGSRTSQCEAPIREHEALSSSAANGVQRPEFMACQALPRRPRVQGD